MYGGDGGDATFFIGCYGFADSGNYHSVCNVLMCVCIFFYGVKNIV
jgi:hypothetical protein